MRITKRMTSPKMTELLNEYIDLLDEEFWEMAQNGKVSRELRRRIIDCELRIDKEHKRLRTEKQDSI